MLRRSFIKANTYPELFSKFFHSPEVLLFLFSFVFVVEVIPEEGASLIDEIAVKQREKRIEIVVKDIEIKQIPSEIADDWFVLLEVPVRAPTFVPPGTADFPPPICLLCVFFFLFCSSTSQQTVTLCP